MKRLILFFGTLFLAAQSHAVNYDFTSRLDHFQVDVTGGKATFDGQPVSAEPFVFVKEVFNYQLGDDCAGLTGKPDLTIIRGDIKRVVYIEKHYISDGAGKCGPITGMGLYLLPLHKNWFLPEKKNLSISLGQEFSLWKDGHEILSLKKTGDKWATKTAGTSVDWDYFDKFINAVQDFKVDFRAHPAAALNEEVKTSTFEIHQGVKVYTFMKIGNKTWAVKLPGTAWLSASGAFGIFESMDSSKWSSPYEKSLAVLRDSHAAVEARLSALHSLPVGALTSARPVMTDVLVKTTELLELRREIIPVLRSSPSTENMLALQKALNANDDLAFLSELTRALRVRYPKGPIVQSSDDPATVRTKITTWKAVKF